MLDQLRERLVAFLARHSVAVLSAAELCPTGALPVAYHADGLDLLCLVPRWSELAYYLEEQPTADAVLLVDGGDAHAQHWLRYAARARLADRTRWTGPLPDGVTPSAVLERYHILSLTPQRLDLIDERQGWGTRETLDLPPATH